MNPGERAMSPRRERTTPGVGLSHPSSHVMPPFSQARRPMLIRYNTK